MDLTDEWLDLCADDELDEFLQRVFPWVTLVPCWRWVASQARGFLRHRV